MIAPMSGLAAGGNAAFDTTPWEAESVTRSTSRTFRPQGQILKTLYRLFSHENSHPQWLFRGYLPEILKISTGAYCLSVPEVCRVLVGRDIFTSLRRNHRMRRPYET